MTTLGATFDRVEPGRVVVGMAPHEGLTQHHGFVHAGAVTSIADVACGYAALSALPPGWDVLSVEFKVNLLAPARGVRIGARGQVLRSGRTLTVSQADVFAFGEDGLEIHVATMLATIIGREGKGS